VWGCAPGEAAGAHVSRFYTPKDARDGRPERDLGAAAAGGRFTGEGLRVRGDGTRFRSAFEVTALSDGDGRLTGFVVAARDRTGESLQDEPLRESDGLSYSDLAEAVPQILFSSTPDGRQAYSNRRFSDYTGRPPAELLDWGWVEAIHPDDRAMVRDVWARPEAVAAGEPAEVEARLRAADGSYRWFLGRAATARDARGQIVRYFGTLTDIDVKRRAEQALRESEARYRLLVETTTDVISRLDTGGRFLYVSPSSPALTGYRPEGMVGRQFTEFVHPEDLARLVEAFGRLLRSPGTANPVEFRLRRPDGGYVWFEANGRAVDTGGAMEVHARARDISERKQAKEALARHAARLEGLRAIDQAVLAARSPEEVGRAALARLARIVPFCQGAVVTFDFRAGVARVLAAHGTPGGPAPPGSRIPLASFSAAEIQALKEGPAVIVPDLPYGAPLPPLARVLGWHGARSYIRIPLAAGGRTFGALALFYDQPQVFDEVHAEVVREVAVPLSIAIRHARLFEEVMAGQVRLRLLSRKLIGAQEAERRRIAREMHDEVGQTLTALKLQLQALGAVTGAAGAGGEAEARLGECVVTVEQTIAQVRNLSVDLRPSLLDDLGLVAALRSYAARQSGLSGVAISMASDESEPRPGPDVETSCFRVVQEALTNVIRHARARSVRIELKQGEGRLRLTVRDDGVGFDLSEARARASRGESLGLLGMHERVALLGGSFRIDSAPGQGTTVRAAFPLEGPGADPTGRRPAP
jgi:PAS domain S-box-containing protein